MSFDPKIVDDAAKEISNLEKLLDNILSADYLLKDALRKRQIRTVIDRLDYIYFSPNGLRKLLENLRDMKIKNREAYLEQAQPEFKADSEDVEEAINQIRKYLDASEVRHGVDFSKLGYLLTYVKLSVREEIWSILSFLDEHNFSDNSLREVSADISQILQKIELLNKAIRLVEQKLKSNQTIAGA
jgi:hypothetical protein